MNGVWRFLCLLNHLGVCFAFLIQAASSMALFPHKMSFHCSVKQASLSELPEKPSSMVDFIKLCSALIPHMRVPTVFVC
jgi:hypothetical protein